MWEIFAGSEENLKNNRSTISYCCIAAAIFPSLKSSFPSTFLRSAASMRSSTVISPRGLPCHAQFLRLEYPVQRSQAKLASIITSPAMDDSKQKNKETTTQNFRITQGFETFLHRKTYFSGLLKANELNLINNIRHWRHIWEWEAAFLAICKLMANMKKRTLTCIHTGNSNCQAFQLWFLCTIISWEIWAFTLGWASPAFDESKQTPVKGTITTTTLR